MHHHKQQVLSRYRELMRLIQRMPEQKAAAARLEAQQTLRQHKDEADPELRLNYLKDLAARISFLRITTPRRPGEPLGGGTYVMRDGELVQGAGEDKGSRYVPRPVQGAVIVSSKTTRCTLHTQYAFTLVRTVCALPLLLLIHSHIQVDQVFARVQKNQLELWLTFERITLAVACCRVTDGSIPMDEAKRLNREHYKRFFGKPMGKEMFL